MYKLSFQVGSVFSSHSKNRCLIKIRGGILQSTVVMMAMMIIPLNIRSFHRQPLEPNGCVMSTDLPWMSEPSQMENQFVTWLWLCYEWTYNMYAYLTCDPCLLVLAGAWKCTAVQSRRWCVNFDVICNLNVLHEVCGFMKWTFLIMCKIKQLSMIDDLNSSIFCSLIHPFTHPIYQVSWYFHIAIVARWCSADVVARTACGWL